MNTLSFGSGVHQNISSFEEHLWFRSSSPRKGLDQLDVQELQLCCSVLICLSFS